MTSHPAIFLDRDGVIAVLRHRGVEANIGTYGLHLEPFFHHLLGMSPEDLPNATTAARQSLALPLFPDMTDGDVDRVTETLAEVLPAART